ncbi:unnamed protein product [Penicillium salamii]|uniref:Phosphoribulokinase/uridine kinase domain-containing protein n=1 Tax=Penicillium salamii TaxID=1612424 RepID=A0A9W4JJ54_9EURO|nr:unnamed protein product [Penicillium salamii]CAG8352656.1 unnamed protein product [Penicillium salamii]CAG8357728.1 unnamed protein product [Penicillium salamii]CAG8402739.1 unnamed protein product [Penicillium salamii]
MADKAVIVGISGPSSSGKTTLARLLQRIFNGAKSPSGNLNTFIIHEDDFYFPDDKIPYTTTASGETIQDWDTAAAIDLPFLSQALQYVRKNGCLPPRLRSKEDQNDESDSGVPEEAVQELRRVVQDRLSGSGSIAFLEGFLLFAPPQKDHVLRSVHDAIQLHVFLPAAYGLVKERREGRSGYVTVGSAPVHEGERAELEENEEIDLEAEDDRPPQNFWVDPPGYVDDVVWPRYVRDHSWLLVGEDGQNVATGGDGDADLVRRAGDGTRVRTDVGVEVAPGAGSAGMEVVLRWAVDLVLQFYIDSRQ